MLTQNEFKYYSKLRQKKIRKIEHKFLVEGKRSVEEALNSRFSCELLIVNETYYRKDASLFERYKNKYRLEKINDTKFLKLCDTKSPQGIVAVLNIPSNTLNIKDNERIIVALDNVSDPGNVGTIIRTCDWFGVKSIIVSEDSVDIYNSKVIRSTMGSIFHTQVIESDNIYSDLQNLQQKGWKILSSDIDGENFQMLKNREKSVLVLSNEAHGPTDALVKLSDKIIMIPKYGKAESLNVASAAAIMISELIVK